MGKQKRQDPLPEMLFHLKERCTKVYIPYLEARIDELEAKAETQNPPAGGQEGE